MKYLAPVLVVLLATGCNDASPPAAAPAVDATPAVDTTPSRMATPAGEARQASSTGVVQAVDTTAQTLTIAHEPVESLGWPGMTMRFQAPGVDLSGIQAGDAVRFEFTSTGMDGTITSISKQ